MSDWLTSREAVKTAAELSGDLNNPTIDRLIEAASRRIERWSRRRFLPETKTRLYRWPSSNGQRTKLYLDADLISVTTLQSEAQNTTPTTIASTDYFLEPNNSNPPYYVIEIDESSTAAFQSGDTAQRSISVLGSWGYSADTRSLGLVDDPSGITSSETTLIVKDGSLITGVSVGDTLLIGSEQVFVVDKDFLALNPDAGGAILLDMAGNLAAEIATTTVTLDASHSVVAGEVIRINTEQMYVLRVATNDLTVVRAFNGSILAAHTNNDAIDVARSLTIERAVNGTTAATIADNAAVSKYEVPTNIQEWCIAEVITTLHQESAGWGRSVGAGEGAREVTGREIEAYRTNMIAQYQRSRSGAI